MYPEYRFSRDNQNNEVDLRDTGVVATSDSLSTESAAQVTAETPETPDSSGEKDDEEKDKTYNPNDSASDHSGKIL